MQSGFMSGWGEKCNEVLWGSFLAFFSIFFKMIWKGIEGNLPNLQVMKLWRSANTSEDKIQKDLYEPEQLGPIQ